MKTLTDEELGELAEAIHDACREWVANGGEITDYYNETGPRCRCPLGALFQCRYPFADEVPLPRTVASGFIAGFEAYGMEPTRKHDPRAYALGQSFRLRYVLGEEA